MTPTRIKAVLALVAILIASVAVYRTLNPSPAAPDLAPFKSLGQGVAREAAKMGVSGKVIVIAPDVSAFPNEALQALVNALSRGLKEASVTVTTNHLVKLDPLRPVRVPPAFFADILRKTTEKDLVISLLGPPLLQPEQRAKVPEKPARVLALCTGETARQVPLKYLFDSGLIHTAIINRSDVRGKPSSFETSYQVVGTSNLADLPPLSPNATLNF